MNATISIKTAKRPRYPVTASSFSSLSSSELIQERSAQFAAALAHEIRNPLTNINLAMEILKRMIRDDEQKIYLDIIMRGSGRIKDLVTDLLTSSEAEKTQQKKYSIHELLNEVLMMTQDRIMLKNITVTKNYAGQDCKLILNRPKMKIALTNIIINAIEAMPPKKGKLKLSTKSTNGHCIIKIEDNGSGISKEKLKTIFKPYITNKPGGMGLGLSTTLHILISNHVRVHVQSEPGKGTQFTLFFEKNQQVTSPFFKIKTH